MTLTSHTRSPASTRFAALLRRWPAWLGAGLAVFMGLGPSEGAALAPALAASAVIYLGAAALRRQSAAFPLFIGTFVVISAAEVLGGIDATWLLLAAAVPFLAYGLRAGGTAADRLPPQTIAMAAFGGVAALALLADDTLGAYLVAAGLLGHAAWDAHHHRTNQVVTRPFAEMCLVLDVLLAALIVLATV
ncbi:hypothetical protein [Streptomyces sp. B6B3]|uniref:hypothetical protein n=1 Tax=Streptomyces sp. B6B3 TaxID=3153570 RepID=UPI00325C4771